MAQILHHGTTSLWSLEDHSSNFVGQLNSSLLCLLQASPSFRDVAGTLGPCELQPILSIVGPYSTWTNDSM